MNSIDYLRHAIKNQAFKYADWHLDCFSLFHPDDAAERNYPFALHVEGDRYYYIDDAEGKVFIDDLKYDGNHPFFNPGIRIDVAPGELNNTSDRALNVPIGNYIFNATTLHYAFGTRLPFQTGRVDAVKMESIIEPLMIDDPEVDDGIAIHASMVGTYKEALALLIVYDSILAPSSSPKTITGDPKIRAYRDKVLKENPDKVNDPAFIAALKEEMVKMDMEYVDDYGRGFLTSKEAFSNVRMMTQGMGGIVEGELIVNSLAEGMDFDKFHLYNNAARGGSIDRSRNTELGGVQTNRLMQAMQNAGINKEKLDCGSWIGVERFVHEKEAKRFIGFTFIAGGKREVITPENLPSLINKTIITRMPTSCKNTAPDYCAVCCGSRIAEHPNGVASAALDLTSRNMYLFMKRMHVSSTNLVDYDPIALILNKQ